MQISKRKLVSVILCVALCASLFFAGYNYGQGTINSFTISSGVYPGAPTYTIFTETIGGTPWYYAKNAYGAISWTSTNCTDVIANTRANNSITFLTSGTFYLPQAIAYNGFQNWTLQGSGRDITFLIQSAGSNRFSLITPKATAPLVAGGGPDMLIQGLVIRDLTIDFNSANQNYDTLVGGTYMSVINIDTCVDALIENVRIVHGQILNGSSQGLGIGLSFNAQVSEGCRNVVNNVIFDTCDIGATESVIASPYDAGYTLKNIIVVNCITGNYWEAGNGGLLENWEVYSPSGTGMRMGNVVENNINVTQRNINVYQAGAVGIQVIGKNLACYGLNVVGSGGVNLYASGDSLIFNGGFVLDGATHGFQCESLSNSTIANYIIKNNSLSVAATYSGLLLTDSEFNSIMGIHSNGGMQYTGIAVGGISDYNSVVGCVVVWNTNFNGTFAGSHNTISGNIGFT